MNYRLVSNYSDKPTVVITLIVCFDCGTLNNRIKGKGNLSYFD